MNNVCTLDKENLKLNWLENIWTKKKIEPQQMHC